MTTAAVTIYDLAVHRLGLDKDAAHSLNGEDFERVGLAMLGGCEVCGASIAAYNAFPSVFGFWRCRDCIGADGWETVEQANHDLFGASTVDFARISFPGSVR